MKNEKQLYEVTRQLAFTAQGKEPADLVVKNGRLVNVCTGEIQEACDIAVRCGRIALVGDASHCVGEHTQVIDAGGMYLTPGFIDGHLHVESSMMTVCEYASCVVPHGTSAIFMDPHEIVNVLGLPGMEAMMEDGEASPLRVYTTTPSCVPASPGLEDTGSIITPADVEKTMTLSGVAGLGEMMNYSGILAGDENAHAIVARALRAGKTVTGHFPLADTGAALNAYIASGISCCHESTAAGQALAKMRLGMYAMIREGSAWHDLPEVIRSLTETGVDPSFAVLVSDDLHADTLLEQGHMDAIIRLAISCGLNPVTAIRMATLNTARCFGLERDIGALAPGKFADINFVSDLVKMRVERVILNGACVAQGGELTVPRAAYAYPESFRHSVRLARQLTPDDFRVHAPANAGSAKIRVIGIHEANVLTSTLIRSLPVQDGLLPARPEDGILKVAVIDRHHPEGRMSVGFVSGFGITKGAVASTYAHDAHNLLIVGANDADMAAAANTLLGCGGGMTAVCGGEVLALIELPVAGLLSDRPAAEVAKCLQGLDGAWKRLGCPLVSPFMTMSLLSLAVIPELRITNRGLVDVMKNQLTSLTFE